MTTSTKIKAKAADAPAAFNRSLAQRIRAKREAVHDFRLTATEQLLGEPLPPARVRIPDLGDGEILNGLPDSLLRTMLQVASDIEAGKPGIAPVDLSKPDEIDITAAKQNAMRQRALVDAYCVAGFIEPRLCLTEDDQTDADDWLLSDIHPADRIAFFNWCNGVHTEAAATVEPFPDRPTEDVATGGPGGVDSEAAERSAPAA